MSLWHARGRHRPGELPRRRVWHLAVHEVASAVAMLVLVSAARIRRGGVGEEAAMGTALRGGGVPAGQAEGLGRGEGWLHGELERGEQDTVSESRVPAARRWR